MITSRGKPVKVVKRIERERIKATDSSADSRTPAQLRREMVAVVISWLDDKKTSKPVAPLLNVRAKAFR